MRVNLYGFDDGRKEKGFRMVVESPDKDARIVMYVGHDEITLWPEKDGDVDSLFDVMECCRKRFAYWRATQHNIPSHI